MYQFGGENAKMHFDVTKVHLTPKSTKLTEKLFWIHFLDLVAHNAHYSMDFNNSLLLTDKTLQNEKDSPFVYFHQQRFPARTELRLRSPCCSGHNEHILATKRPPQWSHRESDRADTHRDNQHLRMTSFEWAHFNVPGSVVSSPFCNGLWRLWSGDLSC